MHLVKLCLRIPVLVLSMYLSTLPAASAETDEAWKDMPSLQPYENFPLSVVVQLTAEKLAVAEKAVDQAERDISSIEMSILDNGETASFLATKGKSTEHTNKLFDQLSTMAAASRTALIEAQALREKALLAHAAAVAAQALNATLEARPKDERIADEPV